MKHELKSWPWFFQHIKSGLKKHDMRSKKDRTFAAGDEVLLREYDPAQGCYTGQELKALVTFITSNDAPCAYSSAWLDRDACILSLEVEKGEF